MLPDATEAPEGFDPSLEVAEEPRDVVDTFRGVSVAAVLLRLGIEGFLKRPLIDGRLAGGRVASVLAPNFDTVTSGPRFSGLGVLEWGILLMVGEGRPCMEDRTPFPAPNVDGVWSDCILLRLLRGLSIVASGFL